MDQSRAFRVRLGRLWCVLRTFCAAERGGRDERRRELGAEPEPYTPEPDELVPAIPLANQGLGGSENEDADEGDSVEEELAPIEPTFDKPVEEELPEGGVRLDLSPRG